MSKSVVAALAAMFVLAIGALAFALHRTEALPDGPQPIAFDHEACAHCHMHVSEPRFAAQLQTDEGEVLNYDDPGCLMTALAEAHPHVHAIWFHHLRENRWISADRAQFVPANPTPMGYGFGVVDAPEKDALDLAAATARVTGGAR